MFPKRRKDVRLESNQLCINKFSWKCCFINYSKLWCLLFYALFVVWQCIINKFQTDKLSQIYVSRHFFFYFFFSSGVNNEFLTDEKKEEERWINRSRLFFTFPIRENFLLDTHINIYFNLHFVLYFEQLKEWCNVFV